MRNSSAVMVSVKNNWIRGGARRKTRKAQAVRQSKIPPRAVGRCAMTPCSSASKNKESKLRTSATSCEILQGSRGSEQASINNGHSRLKKSAPNGDDGGSGRLLEPLLSVREKRKESA